MRTAPVFTNIDKQLNSMTVNEKQKLVNQIHAMEEVLLSRTSLASKMGKSFGTKRDLYVSCGYPKENEINFQHYEARFQRQDIARRIITAPARAVWRKPPDICDDNDPKNDSTAFEEAWQAIVKKNRIYNYIRRTDTLAGIGRYAVLLLGFNDGAADLKIPIGTTGLQKQQNSIQRPKELIFLQPYSEANASIESWNTDKNSPRYNMPELYSLKMRTGRSDNLDYDETLVHWSRIIHVADNLLEDDVYGTPVLKPVYNRLQDLETILAGSAEMFWQGAFPGVIFNIDPEADPGKQTLADLDTEIKNYIHKLRRYIRTQGVSAQQLMPNIADPTNHAKLQLQIIAGTLGIPVRILIGSERGELASSQDDRNWNDRIDERRQDFGDRILRSLIDRLITVGVLPPPQDLDYEIEWPDIEALDEDKQAKIAETRSRTLANYANSIDAQNIYPPQFFLERELGLEPQEINEILKHIEEMVKEEEMDYKKSLIKEEEEEEE